MEIELLGSGRFAPRKRVSSEELDARCGFAAGHLSRACGVEARHVCDGESQIDMAVGAAEAAIAEAGIDAGDIDLVISGCGVSYQALPSTAPLVQQRLGIDDGKAAAFDVSSTCLSFLTGLEMAGRLLNAGQCSTALVFSSDMASRALPWEDDPETAAIFGDGAAAVVLRKGGEQPARIKACLMRTFPTSYEACSIGAGGTRFDLKEDPEAFAANAFFRMDGRELFKVTAKHFAGFVGDLLDKAGWRHDDVDVVVPHQASPFALAHMVRQTGFAREKIVDISAEFGNQIAASIPFAFDMARKDGRIESGSRVLFLGTSAGVSFGGIALEV